MCADSTNERNSGSGRQIQMGIVLLYDHMYYWMREPSAIVTEVFWDDARRAGEFWNIEFDTLLINPFKLP